MSSNSTFKKIGLFFTQVVNTKVSILKILAKSSFTLKFPKIETEKCIVLANGPSLNTSIEKHKQLFKQHSLICVNTFALSKEFSELQPKYYVIIDPFFWQGKSVAIQNTLKAIEEKTTWEMHLFVPYYARKQSIFKELQSKNKNIKITSFNYTVFKGFKSYAQFFYKKNLAMPQSLNVTIAAIFIGINLKFKELLLVGADHTWHENMHMSNENILHTKVTHFYENDSEIKYTPFYKGGIPENGTQKSYEFFDIWSRTFHAYFILNDYAKKVNCKILNASEVTFIDAFKRIKL